ncbi:hypothetical protein FB45DRAFT_936565 [Roridomyces roridus]|uniref:F-box domain-containing protein n=1 Tax=Roridomyces roridus TaxID=1738132 RepID=A0AAD7B9V7_9AGAR|nr:hypothetical protein FB45DRAFT_936565 [Roridomyces roridus]
MFRPFFLRKPTPPVLVLAYDLLPTELWDEIFRHLRWDEDLLQTAKVCKIFNILCLSLFFARYKVPSLDSQELCVDSAVPPALQLSCTPLRSQRLVCQFNHPVGVQRGLAALRNIIGRSNTLRHVDLTFSQDLRDAHERDVSVPGALRSPWRMHLEFWSALSAMALKAPAGRVEIMSQGRFFEGRAADVAGWNRFTRPAASNRSSLFRKRRTTPQPWPIGAPFGYTGRVDLYHIYSVSMHSLSDPNPDSTKAYNTLFVFNAHLVETLYLNTSQLPATLLSDVLPMLDLPALTNVIVPSGVQPASMTEFLLRHPKLEVFEHADYYNRGLQQDSDGGGVLTPTTHPIVHPGLLELKAQGIAGIQRALTALGSSPSLSTLSLTLYPNKSDRERLAELSLGLRVIAERPTDSPPISLALKVMDVDPSSLQIVRRRIPSASFFSLDDEASAIIRSLHCVHEVKITSASRETTTAMLPWLALFPALGKVTFDVAEDEFFERLGPLPDPTAKQEAYDTLRMLVEGMLQGVEVEVWLGCSFGYNDMSP